MQVSRKKTRRYLLQKLYARIYGNLDETRFHEAFFSGILDFPIDETYLNAMYDIVLTHEGEILMIIQKYAPKFDIDTMLKTNILAMWIAIGEMLWLAEEIPAKVSINEAIELTKYFWDTTSKNIVNGILNSFYTHIWEYQNSTQKTSPETPHLFQEI